MKTKIITLAIAVLLGISGYSSANNITPKPSDVEKQIKKQISYPEFAKDQKLEGVVLVSFTVNTDGTITVNTTNQSDMRLKEYVIEKLKAIKLKSSAKEEGTYEVKFNFKFEK